MNADNRPAVDHEVVIAKAADWESTAADVLESAITEVIVEQDRCVVGISGGSTPDVVFSILGQRSVEWKRSRSSKSTSALLPSDPTIAI